MNQMLLALIVVSNLVVISYKSRSRVTEPKVVLATENTIVDAAEPSLLLISTLRI